jgi:hypothetical protein
MHDPTWLWNIEQYELLVSFGRSTLYTTKVVF